MNAVEDMLALAGQVEAAIDRGRALDAWEIAQSSGVALEDWPAGEPRLQAARLAGSVGSSKLCSALHLLNWRADRQDPGRFFQALFYRGRWRTTVELQAEIAAMLKREMPDRTRTDLLSHLARYYGGQHDFERAHAAMDQAVGLRPEDAWVHLQRSILLEAEDRYAESLEAAELACALQPGYRSPLTQRADILLHLGRDEEALQSMLTAHASTTQHAALPAWMQSVYSERGDHERALWCMDEVDRLSPLPDERYRKWIAGRRADFLYMAGDLDGCLEWADQSGASFQKGVAENLRRPGAREKKRVRLEVPFVRQHHMTCAPATLAALAAFWGGKHGHTDIADAICHDGTPWHKERGWAESHGFVTREFQMTPAILHGLIDRGLPFTLTTQWTTGAHLQACIGYDDRTGVILLRDPTQRHFGEMMLEELIREHPVDGPRGMVMVPVAEAARLEGLVFPKQAAYDANHELLKALDGHDRMQVQTALSTLRAVAPDSLLAHQGEARVASWQGDVFQELAATEALLQGAPKLGHALLRKAYLLDGLGRRREHRELLTRLVAERRSEQVFVTELGELLLQDARDLRLAEYYLKRALRRTPGEARSYESMARCRDKEGRHGEARDLRRAAASLVSHEGYSRAYFDSCRITGRTEEGLAFLRRRTRTLGRRTPGPWLTLAKKLSAVNSDSAAAEVLEEARRALPEDAELLLEGAVLLSDWGAELRQRSLEWLEMARGKVAEADWLRRSAYLTLVAGDRPLAIRRWRAVLALQPLSVDAWRGLARLVAEEEGEQAALDLLREATAAHPDQTGLWALRSEWLANRPEECLMCLDRLLALDPANSWALRERALKRLEAGRKEEALADAMEALELQPFSAPSHGILADVKTALGRKEEAREHLRQGLRLDIDYTYGVRQLVAGAGDRSAVLEALGFIEAEMRRQVSNGEIVPVYQELAWRFIPPPELAGTLDEFCRERPDLWETWSACLVHALQRGDEAGALAAAEEMTGRFPLMPVAWTQLARVHRAAGRYLLEEQALAKAQDLSPGWDAAARSHAEVLERLGRLPEAEAVLRSGLQQEPLDGRNYGVLADFLLRNGRRGEALALLVKANEVTPLYFWAWEKRAELAGEDGTQEAVAAALREGGVKFAHRRAWWALAADVWSTLGRREESREAIRRGLELDPGNAGLRDLMASHLADEGDFPAALAICEPEPGETAAPRELEGRRAWLLMASGQPLVAIAAMEELVKREPDYAWGMGELARWLERRSDWEGLRDLAQRWIRAFPHELRALGYLGEAERNLKNSDGAREAYQRAFFLDPEYVFAGRQLADLQMEAKRYDEAAATIRTLRHYQPSANVECDAVELALRTGDKPGALATAARLIDDPAADQGVFDWLGKLMKDHGNQLPWLKLIQERVAKPPTASPGALTAWLQTLPAEGREKKAVKRIVLEPVGSAAREAAWSWQILDLGKRKQIPALRSLAGSTHRPELHGKGRLWADMTEAWLVAVSADDGLRWVDGWRSRPQDWTAAFLVHLAALYEAGGGKFDDRDQGAIDAREAGLARFPSDGNAPAMRASLALQYANRGEVPRARELLGHFERNLAGEYYQYMGDLAQAIVAAAEGREQDAAKLTKSVLGYVGKYPKDASLQAIRMRAEKALVRHLPWTKGKVGRLRSQWQLAKPAGGTSLRPSYPTQVPVGILVVVLLAILRSCGHG